MNLNWNISGIELKNTCSCLFTAVKFDFSSSWPPVMWNTSIFLLLVFFFLEFFFFAVSIV